MARGDYQSAAGHKPNNATVPALVNPPVIFLAPSARTVSDGEIWIAVSCDDTHYGGCIVHASNDGATYTQIGKCVGRSTHGVLTAALASATGTDTSHTLAIDVHLSRQTISGVSQAVVDNHDSFCYVGGEFLAYRDSAMTGTGLYNLSYLHRGLYGSTPGASSGAKFALCNDALFKYRFNKKLVGSTLYLKFQGFNGVGAGLQELSTLTVYAFTVTADGGVKALLSDLSPLADDIERLKSRSLNFIINHQMMGRVATVVGAITLPAGIYPAPSAQMGCGNPAFTATLELRAADGTVLATMGGVAGGVQWRTASAGFTLATPTGVDLMLYTDADLAVAFIHGLTF